MAELIKKPTIAEIEVKYEYRIRAVEASWIKSDWISSFDGTYVTLPQGTSTRVAGVRINVNELSDLLDIIDKVQAGEY